MVKCPNCRDPLCDFCMFFKEYKGKDTGKCKILKKTKDRLDWCKRFHCWQAIKK
jgi:hypothetical protein